MNAQEGSLGLVCPTSEKKDEGGQCFRSWKGRPTGDDNLCMLPMACGLRKLYHLPALIGITSMIPTNPWKGDANMAKNVPKISYHKKAISGKRKRRATRKARWNERAVIHQGIFEPGQLEKL